MDSDRSAEFKSNLNSSNHQNHSPDMFCSDDDQQYAGDDYVSASPSPEPRKLKHEPTPEELVLKLESARLHRLQELLQGVPPPPSITIPQISVADVLRLWKENSSHVETARLAALKEGRDLSWSGSLSRPNSEKGKVLEAQWPEVKSYVYHGVHYNLGTASEDLERLSQKLRERYVGSETSTWCNALSSSIPSSAKKRQRMRGMGHTSPGCRLSHLARRRQTFSSANIAQLSSVAGSGTAGGAPGQVGGPSAAKRLLMGGPAGAQERRRIMVEIKKTDKSKRIKTNSKRNVGVDTSSVPSSSTVRSSSASEGNSKPQVQSTKRALFQSPEEQKQTGAPVRLRNAAGQNRLQQSKRALWPSDAQVSFNGNGKRSLELDDAEVMQRSKMLCPEDRAPYSRTARSLPFALGRSGGGTSGNSSTSSSSMVGNTAQTSSDASKSVRRASDQGPSSSQINSLSDLSEIHKRKLIWAVSQALRGEGVTSKHQEFRPCAFLLAQHYVQIRKDWKGPPPTSTSEHMLQVVSAQAKEVVCAHRAAQAGQEENFAAGGSIAPKREERSNKELFKDATASLNVRRSLCVPISSSSRPSAEPKPRQNTRRVPSARKSLSFDGFGPKGAAARQSTENVDERLKIETEFNASVVDTRANGENISSVSLISAKRVSRSLFLSPKEDSKTSTRKDASEQTCDELSSESCKYERTGENMESSKASSENVPTGEPGETLSCVGDNVNEPNPAGSKTTSMLNQGNPDVMNPIVLDSAPIHVLLLKKDMSPQEFNCERAENVSNVNCPPGKMTDAINTKNSIESTHSSNESEEISNTHPRTLRETKQRAERNTQTQPAPIMRRITRRSLSLAKRRSESTDSAPTESSTDDIKSRRNSSAESGDNLADYGSAETHLRDIVERDVGSFKEAPSVPANSSTLNRVLGSPEFLSKGSNSTQNSPFLGFQPEDIVSVGTVSFVIESSTSIMKVQMSAQGSSWPETTLTPKPVNVNDDSHVYQEPKVITPLLEGGAVESSVCAGISSSSSVSTDLTFRGRIASLKPAHDYGNEPDLKLSTNINVNILNLEEHREKGSDLERWAERASRSAVKEPITDGNSNQSCNKENSVSCASQSNVVDESMLPWEDQSQLDPAASQCPTKLFEEYRSIFDSSSQESSE